MKTEPSEGVNIEHLEAEDTSHIAMDLTCGVLELKTKEALSKARQHVGDSGVEIQDASNSRDKEDRELDDLEDFLSSSSDTSEDEGEPAHSGITEL
eukprot:CAMPEP_0196582222 /NCGR_PEP_ID=MMETSP1081-20130531/38080_1 /TAXON_ID=36882 /ORGANISM="Pyramimonas amylifera, Strain CCMP720" /LENGTH=95 /DNA_ID=CAMNT_0041902725 /DNA_START=446 /DNA_END=733 /DNA_ORIENTATION=+